MAYLADTSAWIKSRQRSAPAWLREKFDDLLQDEEIVICDMVKLELLHHEDRRERFDARRADLDTLPWCPIDSDQWARALDVQSALSAKGGAQHRGVRSPDYLIAAAAESAELTVLHYDGDYDTIAGVTGQQTEWIADRGEL